MIRKRLVSEQGQLLLPMMMILLLFGVYWFWFVQHCKEKYWKMRMDVAADLAAISAARTQAQMLNTMAATQTLMNVSLQKITIFGKTYAHLQRAAQKTYEANYWLLQAQDVKFPVETMNVARLVAKLNGANKIPLSLAPKLLDHQLKGQHVNALLFLVIKPSGFKYYRNAFFARTWFPKQSHPQPPHVQVWRVCHDDVCSVGRARVWLDAREGNGGFPAEDPSLLGGIGIQCLLPQFNAVLENRRIL